MKVFLIFPQLDGRTGVYIKNAFEQLGHEVRVSDPNLASLKSILNDMQSFKPDFTFCSRSFQIVPIAAEIRALTPKLACWNVDVRDNVYEWAPLFPLISQCDIFFTVGDPKQYWDVGFTNACWLPQGIDPDVHRPPEIFMEDTDKYACDIMFVGTYAPEPWHGRYEFLNKLLEQKTYSVKIFGENSPQGLPFLNDKEANVAYGCAGINIGFTGWDSYKYTSVRDWKILATGAKLAIHYTAGAHDLLWGYGIKEFLSFDEFMEKTPDWLHEKPNPAQARRIRHKHTYKHRMRKVIEILDL